MAIVEDFSGGMPADITTFGPTDNGAGTVVSDFGQPPPSLKSTSNGDGWYFTGTRFPVVGDFDISYDLIFDGEGLNKSYFGFWVNEPGPSCNALCFSMRSDANPGWIKYTTGAAEYVDFFSADSSFVLGDWYRVRIQVVGYLATATVTNTTTGANYVTHTIDLTSSIDSTHPRSGTFGQMAGVGNGPAATHRYDNITLAGTATPPTAPVAASASGTTVSLSVGAAVGVAPAPPVSASAASVTVSSSVGAATIATSATVAASATGTTVSVNAGTATGSTTTTPPVGNPPPPPAPPVLPTVDPSTGREPYSLIVVDKDGTRYGELQQASIGTVNWPLNSHGSLSFTLPSGDPKLALCKPIIREVQLWRGTAMLDWFVIVASSKGVGSQVVEFQCLTLDWHFTRRVIADPPQLIEMLTNPDFEQGDSGWFYGYDEGSTVTAPPAHEVQSGRVEAGGFALRLSGGAEGHRQYARQVIDFANPEHAREAVPLKIAARTFVESATGYALDGWGVVIEAFHPATHDLLGYAYAAINKDTPAGRWIDLEASLDIPPDGIYYSIRVSLYGPVGSAVFDFCRLHAEGTVHFYDGDPAEAIFDLAAWAQSPVFGKTDLNIRTYWTPTPARISRTYPMVARTSTYDAMRDFSTVDGGVEFGAECTPTIRAITTYYPRKGADTDVVLALGGNLHDYGYQIDGELAASRIIMQLAGRERSATDTSQLEGMVVERVLQARPESSLGTLTAQTDQAMERAQRPAAIGSLLMHPAATTELLNRVRLGDRVRVDIPDPLLDLNGRQCRISQITLDVAADQLTYVPTRED